MELTASAILKFSASNGNRSVEAWAADDRFASGEAIHMNGDPGGPFAGGLAVNHVRKGEGADPPTAYAPVRPRWPEN